MKKFRLLCKVACSLVFLLVFARAFSQTPEVKIDFNMSGRPAAEVQEPGYTPWTLAGTQADSITVSGVKFIVKKGPRGNQLSPTWYKAGLQESTFDTRFTNDGVS